MQCRDTRNAEPGKRVFMIPARLGWITGGARNHEDIRIRTACFGQQAPEDLTLAFQIQLAADGYQHALSSLVLSYVKVIGNARGCKKIWRCAIFCGHARSFSPFAGSRVERG